MISIRQLSKNGCRIYVDIITGENCRQFGLQYPIAFHDQDVYRVGEEWMGHRMGIW